MKIDNVGTHLKRLNKVLLINSHIISFHKEIRKLSILFVEKKKASYLDTYQYQTVST